MERVQQASSGSTRQKGKVILRHQTREAPAGLKELKQGWAAMSDGA